MQLGYHLSSEEHGPAELVSIGAMAEGLGFDELSISDHFHPWTNGQGHSPFVWHVVGGLAATLERAAVTTLVTCPILRLHPLIVAQAAATAATALPGRFRLGLGTGERLNEHVTGSWWPPASVRQDMLDEAMSLMEEAWTGKLTTFRGSWFTADNARIFDVPDDGVPVVVAASGTDSARLAAGRSQGLCTTSPDPDVVAAYRDAGGPGPVIGMQHLCWAPSRDEALDVVRRWWPHAGGPHVVNAELAIPEHFEAVAEATVEHLADALPMGDDPVALAEALGAYDDAGFDLVYVHQVGQDQQGAARFVAEQVRPELGLEPAGRSGSSRSSAA